MKDQERVCKRTIYAIENMESLDDLQDYQDGLEESVLLDMDMLLESIKGE